MGRHAILITPDFPPLTGGIQLVLHRLVTHTERIEWEVVTLSVPGARAFDAESEFEVRRVGSRGGRMHKLAVARLNATAAARALRRRPDVIVSGHVTASLAAAAAGRLGRVPMIQYVHADEFRTRPGLTRTAIRRAAAVIAVSGYTKEMAVAAGADPGHVHVINPGVDLPPPAGDGPREKAERPTLLTIARMFNAYKGHDLVIRALPRVLEQVPDAHWVVIGDGPLRDSIEALACEHGVQGAISFLGRVDDETRDEWLARADVFTMPSRIPEEGAGGEGFGIVYLEAGAHRLPVVAGRIGGALDAVVAGETGLLVDPNDPDELAEALVGLLRDRERAAAMGVAGLARARRMTWAAHARSVEGVIDDLLEPVMSRARVLYVNHVTRISGAERSMLDLIDHLPERYEPLAAVADGDLVAPLAERGIETCILDELTLSFRLDLRTTPRGLAWIPRTARCLRRFATSHQVELLHANDTRSGFPAGLAARFGGPPAVVHVRDRLPGGALGRAAGALISRTADGVLSNSEFVAEGFGGARSRLSVVPNAVDTERFDPDRYDRARERAALGLRDDEDTIAIVGHLTPLKAQDDAVSMLAGLSHRERPARLLIVGSVKFTGPGTAEDNVAYERRLRALVAELGLGDRVDFLGEREDVAAVLAASDILVTPSWREGFGRVVLEGMAMRLPVIATDVGGPAEIVRSGEDGLLLPPRSPERWAAAVGELLDRPDRGAAIGDAARERVRRDYGIDRYVTGVAEIYDTLLRSR